jgi:S1-C subfamily serine protease
VTNYHVVDGAQKYYVFLSDNSLLPAQLIGVDPADDLAVLKITTPKHLSTISFGDSSLLQVGDSVIAIGYPVADLVNVITSIGKIDGSTVTNGIISALEREQPWGSGGKITDAIQTDAELNPGNSGGALVNMQAQLIGIPTQILTYEDSTAKVVTPANRPIKGIGFAIPSNRVAFVASQLIQYGYMVHTGHATIGATLVSVTPALATLDSLAIDHGAYISEVEAGGPAALAGLQTGDVIVRVNTTPITNALDMTDALMPMDAGATVTLGIVRGTQQMQVKVKLQASPTSVQIIGKG